MATRRRANKQRRGRELSAELETFLAGDDSVIADERSLRDLAAEVFFVVECPQPNVPVAEFTSYEERRLEMLEDRYQELRRTEALRHYRSCAKGTRCLQRFERLLADGEDPGCAFSQAVNPGPNSSVYGVPDDDVTIGKPN